jgi:hypothetical protein
VHDNNFEIRTGTGIFGHEELISSESDSPKKKTIEVDNQTKRKSTFAPIKAQTLKPKPIISFWPLVELRKNKEANNTPNDPAITTNNDLNVVLE